MTAPTWRQVPGSAGLLLEGPRWLPGVELFQWVDILGSTLFRWDPYSDAPAERRKLALDYTTVALPVDDDRSLVASKAALHEYRWSDDSCRELGSWDFPVAVRFNDGGISPDGGFYVGTMSMDRRSDAARLYRFSLTDLELTPIVSGVGISNGLAWASPSVAYYIDSLKPRVLIGDLRSTSPDLRAFHHFADDDEPDGLTVTPEGNVLVAMWMGSRLIELDRSGSVVDVIEVPAGSPTSVCVGGRHGELLLATTAAEGGDSEFDGMVLVTPRL